MPSDWFILCSLFACKTTGKKNKLVNYIETFVKVSPAFQSLYHENGFKNSVVCVEYSLCVKRCAGGYMNIYL